MKRIYTVPCHINLVVMLVLSIVLSIGLLSVAYFDSRSIGGLLVFAVVFGFGGSVYFTVLCRNDCLNALPVL